MFLCTRLGGDGQHQYAACSRKQVDLLSSMGGKELGAFFIVQVGVNINVFFTVFLWMHHKISLCREQPGRRGEGETSRASADGRQG